MTHERDFFSVRPDILFSELPMTFRPRHALAALMLLSALLLAWLTPLFSNALMLLMDRDNFIPEESSIWTFEPTLINQGSANYWLYGEDQQHYFYFSYAAEGPYQVIARNNRCESFDKHDYRTWCAQ